MTVHMFPGAGCDSNIFLVTGTQPILVDTGSGLRSSRIIKEIEGITDHISKIILTHCHFDHAGGAAELSKHFNAPVFIHKLDAAAVRNGLVKETAADMFGCEMPATEVTELQGSEMIDTGEHRFDVVCTPGHTAGGISLFDRTNLILFSGDTVFAEGVGRWDFPTGDLSCLKRSVHKLAELDASYLYPGHGPCVKGSAKSKIVNALMYVEGF